PNRTSHIQADWVGQIINKVERSSADSKRKGVTRRTRRQVGQASHYCPHSCALPQSKENITCQAKESKMPHPQWIRNGKKWNQPQSVKLSHTIQLPLKLALQELADEL